MFGERWGRAEGMEMEIARGSREHREVGRGDEGPAVNVCIIQFGEMIGLCLTSVWPEQPHTVP